MIINKLQEQLNKLLFQQFKIINNNLIYNKFNIKFKKRISIKILYNQNKLINKMKIYNNNNNKIKIILIVKLIHK